MELYMKKTKINIIGWIIAIIIIATHVIIEMIGVNPVKEFPNNPPLRWDQYIGSDGFVYFILPIVLYVPLAPFCIQWFTGQLVELKKHRSVFAPSKSEKCLCFVFIFWVVIFMVILAYSPLYQMWLHDKLIDKGITTYDDDTLRYLYYCIIPFLYRVLLILITVIWIIHMLLFSYKNKQSLLSSSNSFICAGSLAALYNIRKFLCRIDFYVEDCYGIVVRSAPRSLRNSLIILLYGILFAVVFYRHNAKKQSQATS